MRLAPAKRKQRRRKRVEPHCFWADLYRHRKTVLSLARMVGRLTLDPTEGARLRRLADELTALPRLAEQQAEYHRPRSELERQVSTLWYKFESEGGKVTVSENGSFARFLKRQLRPRFSISRVTAKRLIKREKRRRELLATAIFAGEGRLTAHADVLKAAHQC
jgi:hypothetical protein